MIGLPLDAIEARATRLAVALAGAGWTCEVLDGASAIGGGSAPGLELPTRLVALSRPDLSAVTLEAALRASNPPVIARIQDDRVVLDLRTVFEDQDPTLAAALRAVQSD
jgi:L-seryl-tRNA(Ser) seleniumtransferase